jgi:ElaB/YqjD/DUF883 family membrane-anchored ribosome-binding protein
MDELRTRLPQDAPGGAPPYGASRADAAAAAVGRKLESAAAAIRERLPHAGRAGAAVEAVSDRLEASGTYLEEQGLTGVMEDVESLIRRYPVQALMIGFGIGYLLSRLVGGRHG